MAGLATRNGNFTPLGGKTAGGAKLPPPQITATHRHPQKMESPVISTFPKYIDLLPPTPPRAEKPSKINGFRGGGRVAKLLNINKNRHPGGVGGGVA